MFNFLSSLKKGKILLVSACSELGQEYELLESLYNVSIIENDTRLNGKCVFIKLYMISDFGHCHHIKSRTLSISL